MAEQVIDESAHDVASFSVLLKSIFEQFYLWRETSSDKTWALEKLKDVLLKEIKRNPKLVTVKDFAEFMNRFFDDDGNLVQYPDFVMIEVSKMVTGIILNSGEIEEQDLNVMFKFLQSPIIYGQIGKGHRVSTMFECMTSLLHNNTAVERMRSFKFYTDYSLLFATAGTENYTRKSASTFFVELIKFVLNVAVEANGSRNSEHWIKESVSQSSSSETFCLYNKNLTEYYRTADSTTLEGLGIVANHCRLFALCSQNFPDGDMDCALPGRAGDYFINNWWKFLKKLSEFEYDNTGDVAVESIEQLALQAVYAGRDLEKVAGMLTSILFLDFIPNVPGCVSIGDLMQMTGHIGSKCIGYVNEYNRKVLSDLAILPLLVVLDIDCSRLDSRLSPLVEITKKAVEKESEMKHSSLIDYAMRSAFSFAWNFSAFSSSNYASVFEYVTFITNEPPENTSRSFLNDGSVTSKQALKCLVQGFQHFKNVLDNVDGKSKMNDETTNIQQYFAPVLSYPGITDSDLTATVECFKTLLHFLGASGESAKEECIQDVVKALEIHLVNIDPNVREAAVEGLGQLSLIDIEMVTKELAANNSLQSLWGCVKDKEENIVTKVFDFVLQIARLGNAEKLEEITTQMQTTKEEIIREVQTCLLSRQRDAVKPVAFSLLTSLSDPSDVIRYAEVCVQQSSYLAAPAVFEFIDKLVKKQTDSGDEDLEGKVDRLCDLLMQGWGDLIVSVIHGENTTCLRYALDILVSIQDFITKTNVASLVEKRMKDFVQANREWGFVEKMAALKDKMTQYSKQIVKGSHLIEEGEAQQVKSVNDDVQEVSHSESGAKFDCTIEMGPLELSKKPFYLPEMVCKIVGSSEEKTQSLVWYMFVWAGFQELLDKLSLSHLHKEAHESTDEYERNPLAILQDVNELLHSSFKFAAKKMAKEIIEIFISEIREIMDHCINSDEGSSMDSFVKSLKELNYTFEHFSLSKESFFKFALSKRKSVLIRNEGSFDLEFNSEFFQSGLELIEDDFEESGLVSNKEYFSSKEGMKQLLEMFFPHGTDEKSDEDLTDSKPSHTVEDFQKAVEDIKKAGKSECSDLMIDVLRRAITWCLQIVKTGQRDVSTMNTMSTGLKELEEWYSEDAEDGFDSHGDNDPTLTDCY